MRYLRPTVRSISHYDHEIVSYKSSDRLSRIFSVVKPYPGVENEWFHDDYYALKYYPDSYYPSKTVFPIFTESIIEIPIYAENAKTRNVFEVDITGYGIPTRPGTRTILPRTSSTNSSRNSSRTSSTNSSRSSSRTSSTSN